MQSGVLVRASGNLKKHGKTGPTGKGWWNLYRRRRGEVIECVLEMPAEFGSPPWELGDSTYAFESAQRIVCAYIRNGINYLASIDTESNRFEEIETPYTSIAHIRAASGRMVFLGGSPSEFTSVVEMDLQTAKTRVLRCSSEIKLDPAYLSTPEAIEFPTENGLSAHAFFYPPKNRDYIGSDYERPPLLVISHGGPTASSESVLKLPIQYWTSRGIAVLDVNYGGSSGYGRSYRQRLNGQWGVVDVDDCVNGAR
jgi:dipeptidyl aminopeptidase/acylaminoacyl peptidase